MIRFRLGKRNDIENELKVTIINISLSRTVRTLVNENKFLAKSQSS